MPKFTEKHATKIKTAKTVTKFVVSNSVKATVAAIVINNLPAPESKKQALQFTVGAAVVGMIASNVAKTAVDHEFDDWIQAIDAVQSFIQNQTTETIEETQETTPN